MFNAVEVLDRRQCNREGERGQRDESISRWHAWLPSRGGNPFEFRYGYSSGRWRPLASPHMPDLRTNGSKSRQRAVARNPEAVPASPHTLPEGVSNHLLARALLTGNPSVGATLQRFFQYNDKKVPPAKVPRIHSASGTDLKKLADDKDHDYGAITDAASVAAAMERYTQNHTFVETPPELDEMFTGNRTVWDDAAFAEHDELPVRATFQLDSGQGKHDETFAASDKGARKKAGGQKMPSGTDYRTLAQGVPADLTRDRLDQIFANPVRTKLDFSVQKSIQADGYQYEISAMWAPLDGGWHVLVYYHCYPPR